MNSRSQNYNCAFSEDKYLRLKFLCDKVMQAKMNTPSTRTRQAAKLVMAALEDMNDNGGSSVDGIVEHITNEYQVPTAEFKRFVPGVIEKGIAFGAIDKKYGRLMLGEVMDRMRDMRRRRKRKGGAHKRRTHRKRR